jgi:hypothetical protein
MLLYARRKSWTRPYKARSITMHMHARSNIFAQIRVDKSACLFKLSNALQSKCSQASKIRQECADAPSETGIVAAHLPEAAFFLARCKPQSRNAIPAPILHAIDARVVARTPILCDQDLHTACIQPHIVRMGARSKAREKSDLQMEHRRQKSQRGGGAGSASVALLHRGRARTIRAM